MKPSAKPVRKCYACLLNRGDHCWIYKYPRGQWRGTRHCPGFDNEALYAQYRTWLKQPAPKTRRQLRQDYFRTKRKDGIQASE